MISQRLAKKNLEVLADGKEYKVYLHRTALQTADNVMNTGLNIGASADSTLTSGGVDQFVKRHWDDQVVVVAVVVNLPRNIKLKHAADWLLENGQTNEQGGVIPNRYIRGYISRSTGEFIKNPQFREVTEEENSKLNGYEPKVDDFFGS